MTVQMKLIQSELAMKEDEIERYLQSEDAKEASAQAQHHNWGNVTLDELQKMDSDAKIAQSLTQFQNSALRLSMNSLYSHGIQEELAHEEIFSPRKTSTNKD